MEITSLQNPKVKEWASLLDKKGREKQQQFLIEGVHLVKEALQSDADVRTVVYSLERGIPKELAPLQSGSSVEWTGVSEQVLAKCTDTQTPQSVFAVVWKLRWQAEQLLDAKNSLVVVVDGVQDPGNLGTMIRSADAVNATGVVLGRGTADLYNPKSVRSTMGSLFHLPIVEADLTELLPVARARSIQLVNTSLQAQDSLYEADLRGSTWLVVGNEGQGVSEAVARHVDKHVKIPMPGRAESLNVAMATTVLLFEALRQRSF